MICWELNHCKSYLFVFLGIKNKSLFGSWAPSLKKSSLLSSRRSTKEKYSQIFLSSSQWKALLVWDQKGIKFLPISKFNPIKRLVGSRLVWQKNQFGLWSPRVKAWFGLEDSPSWFKISRCKISVFLEINCSRFCSVFGLETNPFKPLFIIWLEIILKIYFVL